MARYTTPISNGSLGSADFVGSVGGTFLGTVCSTQNFCVSSSVANSSAAYRSDNFITIMCCNNWCLAPSTAPFTGTICFMQCMNCFDQVNFTIGYPIIPCSPVTPTIQCLLVVSNYNISTSASNYVICNCSPYRTGTCYQGIVSCTYCYTYYNVDFFPMCTSGGQVLTFTSNAIGFNVNGSDSVVAASRGSGCILVCNSSDTSGAFVNWCTFNGIALGACCMGGAGFYSMRARVRCA